MITSKTHPLLVTSRARATGVVHFASGDPHAGVPSYIPYCRSVSGGGGHRIGSPNEFDKLSASYTVVTGKLMNCRGCAEIIWRNAERGWRPNHHPLMEPDLRWI